MYELSFNRILYNQNQEYFLYFSLSLISFVKPNIPSTQSFQRMHKAYQNYRLSEHKFKGRNIYILECMNDKQSYLVTTSDIMSVMLGKRSSILNQLYQNGSIIINKQEIFKEIISKVLSSTKLKKKIQILKLLQQREQKVQKVKNFVNINKFFIKSKLGMMTTKLWQRCYRLIHQFQLLQVVGRRAKKDFKKYDYLIKFKYFDNPQTFIWLRAINFSQHPCLRALKDFDDKNPIKQEFLIHEKYKFFQEYFRKKLFSSHQKRYQVLGKSKIGIYMYFLFKEQRQDICRAQWYMHYVIPFPSKDRKIINKKLRQSNFNLKIQPFIDREKIRQILISQMGKISKHQDNQLKLNYDKQMIDNMVNEKAKLFIQKFQKLKEEVNYFYRQSVKIQDFQQDCSKIHICDKNKDFQKKSIHCQQNLTENLYVKKQINQKIIRKHENLAERLPINQVNFKQQIQEIPLISYKKQFSTEKSLQTQQDSRGQISLDKIEQKFEEFYYRVKQEFKKQFIKNYLNYEESKQKRSRKIHIKRQKIQNQQKQFKNEYKNQINMKIQNYETETKKQDEQTTVEQSNEERTVKIQH